MEDKMFPKYQYSVFLKNGRDEQIVIRANDLDEFLKAKENVNKILEKVEQKIEEKTPAPITNSNGMNCMTCGAPATQRSGVSKTKGTAYNGIFCSTDNKSHTKWL